MCMRMQKCVCICMHMCVFIAYYKLVDSPLTSPYPHKHPTHIPTSSLPSTPNKVRLQQVCFLQCSLQKLVSIMMPKPRLNSQWHNPPGVSILGSMGLLVSLHSITSWKLSRCDHTADLPWKHNTSGLALPQMHSPEAQYYSDHAGSNTTCLA